MVNSCDLTKWFHTIHRTGFLFAEMAAALPVKQAAEKHGVTSMPAALAIQFAQGLHNQSRTTFAVRRNPTVQHH